MTRMRLKLVSVYNLLYAMSVLYNVIETGHVSMHTVIHTVFRRLQITSILNNILNQKFNATGIMPC